jgi:nicotinamidase-related amidase
MRALLIVDLQNDYFEGGRMPLAGTEAAADRARALLRHCREQGLPRWHVQHLSVRPGASFFVPDTPGAEIHPSVAPADGETVVRKHFPNAFRDTPLLDALRAAGITELVVCGAMSHLCIDATTRAAADLGFGCAVAHDACATRALSFGGVEVPAPQVHAAFMAALSGSYARMATAATLIDEWRGRRPG